MKQIRQKERLTSKERVMKVFAHENPDRIPINYFANSGIDARLKKYFGLSKNDNKSLREILGVDFRGVAPKYKGPRLHQPIEERLVDPLWGIRKRWIEHETGGYWDFCDFPLKLKMQTLKK